MVIESIRLRLAPAIKKRFEQGFRDGLTAPPDGHAASLLAETTGTHALAGVDYRGQKTHQKKVLDYLKKAERATFTEEQLERLCRGLVPLQSQRLTQRYLDKARRKFPENPTFPLLEAEQELSRGPGLYYGYRVRNLLEDARRKAEKLPHGPRRERLFERVHDHLQKLEALDPLSRAFENIFGEFDPFGEEDDSDDEW
jgi:hypothetical protein